VSGGAPLTPRVREIVTAALGLLEEQGAEALTMRALAGRLGIRAPSLYKHLSGKGQLETTMIAVGFEELAAALEGVADEGPDRLAELGGAYRAFALGRPHLYRLMTERPLDRDQLPPGLEDRASALLVVALGADPDRARAAWAFAHGMIMLELNGRFPPAADLGAAWRAGLAAFGAGW
jgi:AcrR family transcriptional regulator